MPPDPTELTLEVRARLVATGMAGGAAPPAGVAAAAAGAGAGAGGGRTSEEGCVTPRKGGGGRAGPVRKNEGQAEQTKERQQTHTAHTQKTKRSADVGVVQPRKGTAHVPPRRPFPLPLDSSL